MQFTSPMRRHLDLVVHWQLRAFLAEQQSSSATGAVADPSVGTAAAAAATSAAVRLDAAQLAALLRARAGAARRAAAAQKESTEYWLYEYLARGIASARTYEVQRRGRRGGACSVPRANALPSRNRLSGALGGRRWCWASG